MTLLLVAVGAALGAPTRYAVTHLLDARSHPGTWRMHWGTVLVNVVGSFLLGVFSGLGLGGAASAFLGVGFCGALTTYSAFAVQTHDLGPRRGTWNVLLTVPPALALCALGFHLAT